MLFSTFLFPNIDIFILRRLKIKKSEKRRGDQSSFYIDETSYTKVKTSPVARFPSVNPRPIPSKGDMYSEVQVTKY